MLLFHLDRLNTLPAQSSKQLLPVKTCNTLQASAHFKSLYPSGVSKTGQFYLNPFDSDLSDDDSLKQTCENYRIYCIEYIFEIVRQMYFSCLPSRFESLFACKNKDDIITWSKILSCNSMDISNATVKIIDANNGFFIGDAKWRDMPLNITDSATKKVYPVFSPFAYHEWAIQYWSGMLTDRPRMEVLCKLPVTVVESVPLSEFLCGLM